MNLQYSSFRNAWIAFNIPTISAGMLIFTVVLLDLLFMILKSRYLFDLKSLGFLTLRMIIASSPGLMFELKTYQL